LNMPVAPLPDLDTLDAAALKDMVIRQHAQISSHDAEVERLRLIIARLRRLQFGRKSEKIQREIEQLELQLEDLEAGNAEKQEKTERTLAPAAAAVFAAATRKPARRPLPDHLPREVQVHAPGEKGCPACGGHLSKLGEDVSEMLEYVPARFKVIRHVRPKLSCTRCDTIVQAEAPSRPIARGLASPGLLAHVLVSKYSDHLPLYRQSEIYAREGVELERSTLADWVGATSELLKPLHEALRQYVISARKLHADDTPVPVLAPGQGKTKQGRLWTYVRDDRPAGDTAAPAVWFAYSPDRRGEHPHRHLEDFNGTLQADAYAGFNRLYDGGHIQEAACWAHVRRKFFDLHEAHRSPITTEALERIGSLYVIESEIRGRSPDERRRERQTRSRPLLISLQSWLKESLTRLSRKSETAVAINYALGHWPALVRYCDDGLLEIDNNTAERALRAVALGRKNYLFAGSDSGGERAATIYSLIGSARLNDLDPEAYLRGVLTRIADHPINRIGELLPWRIQQSVPGNYFPDLNQLASEERHLVDARGV
jgi:transposase